MSEKYEVKEVRVFKYPHTTVRVSRPALPEEEYNRRLKGVYKAAEQVLIEVEKNKRKKGDE